MRDYKNGEINPEEYWPDAERMLNQHYAAKRRRRRIVFFSLFLAVTIGTFYLMKDTGNTRFAAEQPEIQKASSATNGEAMPKREAGQKEGIREELSMAPVSSSAMESADEIPKGKNSKSYDVETGIPSKAVSISSQPVRNYRDDNGEGTTSVATAAAQNEITVMSDETIPSTSAPELVRRLPYLETSFRRPDSVEDYRIAQRKELQLKSKSRWDLLLYAGGGVVQKNISGTGNTVYLDRREKEEKPAYLPYAGLQLSKSVRNWSLRGGLEFAVIGEQVKYSPYRKGEYYHSYNEWEPYSYTISDTDSVYIFGNLFLNTRLETINDSLYVTKTDTLNGLHYDPTLQANNGINRWYIVEVPLEMVYHFYRGRWGAGISAGVAPGVVVQSSGRYLRDDECSVARYRKENTGKLSLNARAGLEFSYLVNENIRLMLRPSGRFFLTKMEGGNNTRQRYHSAGLNAGILYMIP